MELIILTGCSGQLGNKIIDIAKKNNINVFGIDLKNNNSKGIELIKGDVRKKEDVHRLFSKIKNPNQYSNITLINNAGIAVFSPTEDRTLEEFNEVMSINLFGPINCSNLFANWIEENKLNCNQNQLNIINVGSIYGIVAPDSRIYSDTSRNSSEVYGASKAGLIQLTRYFAVKFANIPIFVNCVSPGGILNKELQGPEFISNYSNRVPLNSLCDVHDIASFMINLSQSKNKFLTGQNITIDGGLTAW